MIRCESAKAVDLFYDRNVGRAFTVIGHKFESNLIQMH